MRLFVTVGLVWEKRLDEGYDVHGKAFAPNGPTDLHTLIDTTRRLTLNPRGRVKIYGVPRPGPSANTF